MRVFTDFILAFDRRIVHRFLLGEPDSTDERQALQAEQAEWGDLLQLPVADAYKQITGKTLGFFRWAYLLIRDIEPVDFHASHALS